MWSRWVEGYPAMVLSNFLGGIPHLVLMGLVNGEYGTFRSIFLYTHSTAYSWLAGPKKEAYKGSLITPHNPWTFKAMDQGGI